MKYETKYEIDVHLIRCTPHTHLLVSHNTTCHMHGDGGGKGQGYMDTERSMKHKDETIGDH